MRTTASWRRLAKLIPPRVAVPTGAFNQATTSVHRGDASRPIASVIIPTHNRAHCLPGAIESVLAQEQAGDAFDVEVIVVDDGSCDATGDVVRRYGQVRYIRLAERRGVSAALNQGLRASRGTYITFLGDDDTFLPHKLRVQIAALHQHPSVGVVYGQSIVRFKNHETLFPSADYAPSGRVFDAILMGNSFASHHAALLIRRDVFQRVGEFDETLAAYEDYDMSLRMAFHVPFLFRSGAVTVYNLSPNGLWLSRATQGLGVEETTRAVKKTLQKLPQSGRHAKLRVAARVGAKFLAAPSFVMIGDPHRAWEILTEAVREYPGILRDVGQRAVLRWVAREWARSTVSPLSAMYDCCREIDSAVQRGGNIVDGWFARRTLGSICAEIAFTLAADPSVRSREAACAAVSAIARAPWNLRRKALLRLILRALLLNGR